MVLFSVHFDQWRIVMTFENIRKISCIQDCFTAAL